MEAHQGAVKSYNGAKGFGFIQSDTISGDVFFGRSELPADCREVQGKFLEGRSVSFTAETTHDGKTKATSVVLNVVEGDLLPGMVKTFNDKNGYGFIESSCTEGDIRFDRKALGQNLQGPIDYRGKLVLFLHEALSDGKLRATKVEFQSGKSLQAAASMAMPMHMYQPMPMYQQPMYQQYQPMPMQMYGGGCKGWGAPAGGKGYDGYGMMQGGGCKGGWQGGGKAGGGGGMMTGTVKTFSAKNGYGFITSPSAPGDVKFGLAEITGGDVNSLGAGAQVRFKFQNNGGKLSATEVSLGGAHPSTAAVLAQGMKRAMGSAGGPPQKVMKGCGKGKPQTYSTGEMVTGSIKSFNMAKGFGFIESPQVGADVFFMKSDFPQDAIGMISAGASCYFELVQTNEGKLRAQNCTPC